MDAVDVLMEARAYVDKGWTQHFYVVDERGYGRLVNEAIGQAFMPVAWCAVGAIRQSSAGAPDATLTDAGREAWRLLRQAIGTHSTDKWNDIEGRTKEEVLEAYDRAISLGLEEAGDR